jgi:hypothetical protein
MKSYVPAAAMLLAATLPALFGAGVGTERRALHPRSFHHRSTAAWRFVVLSLSAGQTVSLMGPEGIGAPPPRYPA